MHVMSNYRLNLHYYLKLKLSKCNHLIRLDTFKIRQKERKRCKKDLQVDLLWSGENVGSALKKVTNSFETARSTKSKKLYQIAYFYQQNMYENYTIYIYK